MCRLYGFHSTAPRKVECELIASQNSLIAQSANDEYGHSNPHGWGLVTYYDGEPHADRQIAPAFSSDRFRWSAAQAYSRTVLAHVRSATIGSIVLENTHPFVHGRHAFAHNGTIGAFDRIKEKILEEMGEEERASIKGTTDSEHFFHLLHAGYRCGRGSMGETLKHYFDKIAGWSAVADPSAELALNVIWTDGETMVGSRLGRSLWFTRRDEAHTCEICGTNHAGSGVNSPYSAVVLASERITLDEKWQTIENGSVFEIRDDCEMCVVEV